MTRVLVIHENTPNFDEGCVIGVADSVDNAMMFIKDYFGKYKQIHFEDVLEARIESEFTIEYTNWDGSKKESVITLEWFELNKA